jgi:adenylate kinase family enzyme
VVVLEAPEETVRARMKARAREDDTNEAIERRLAWYRAETKAILGYFTEAPRFMLHHIDALQDIDAVRAQIAQALNLHDS